MSGLRVMGNCEIQGRFHGLSGSLPTHLATLQFLITLQTDSKMSSCVTGSVTSFGKFEQEFSAIAAQPWSDMPSI